MIAFREVRNKEVPRGHSIQNKKNLREHIELWICGPTRGELVRTERGTDLPGFEPSHTFSFPLLCPSLVLSFSFLPSNQINHGSRKKRRQWNKSCARRGLPFRLNGHPPATFRIAHSPDDP